MPKKRIAVITARADDRTQKDIICGIAEAALAVNTDVAVFSNIYNVIRCSHSRSISLSSSKYRLLKPSASPPIMTEGIFDSRIL